MKVGTSMKHYCAKVQLDIKLEHKGAKRHKIKLRGSCIHHDNGIIGAATLERAEERRCRQLKEAGFNCFRSSHHPASKAMLDACDVYFWEGDSGSGSAKGAELNRLITERFHSLDHTRYVAVAINGLLAGMNHMGEIMCSIMGISMEEMAEKMAAQASHQEETSIAGIDQANGSIDLMFGPTADAFAQNEILSGLLEEFALVTDLTGYNYLTARHEMEHGLYPKRVVLDTETLPADIVRLWKIVKENPHVIGDMTWTVYDYLGEAGSSVLYYDGRHGFMPNWPISVAYMKRNLPW